MPGDSTRVIMSETNRRELDLPACGKRVSRLRIAIGSNGRRCARTLKVSALRTALIAENSQYCSCLLII